MLKSLLERIRGDEGPEPEAITLRELPVGPGNEAAFGRAMRERLLVTPCAAPRAFYDAPALQRLARGKRIAKANRHALWAASHCPPYHERRADPAQDLLFLMRAAATLEDTFRVEVEYGPDGQGGRVRDLLLLEEAPSTRPGPAPPAPGSAPLPPERVLELEQVLRRGRFWQQPATDDRDGVHGVTWYLSRLERGRHHLIVRWEPEGQDRELLESLAAVLDDELAALAEARRAVAAQAPRVVEPPRRCVFWAECKRDVAPGERSGLCADHRRRVDAQGANSRRR